MIPTQNEIEARPLYIAILVAEKMSTSTPRHAIRASAKGKEKHPDLESNTLAPRAEEAGTGKITPWPEDPPDTPDDLGGPASGQRAGLLAETQKEKQAKRDMDPMLKSSTSHETKPCTDSFRRPHLNKCAPTLASTKHLPQHACRLPGLHGKVENAGSASIQRSRIAFQR